MLFRSNKGLYQIARPLKPFFTDILISAVVGILSSALILLLVLLTGYETSSVHPAFLSIAFLPVSAISLLLIHIGSRKDPSTQTSLALGAIAIKFLLPAILALIWFVTLKNSTFTDIFLFIVVYLSFGISTVLLILKKLRNQP